MPRRRRSKKEELKEIPREQQPAAVAISIGLIALFVGILISSPVGFLIMVGGILIAYWIYKYLRKEVDAYFRSQQTLNQLRAMSPSEFEEFLAWLFRQQGYDVKMTARKGDHGVDLVLSKEGRTYGVQAKRFGERQKVGEPMLREFYGSFEDFGAQEGYFITTSSFTQSARDWVVNKRGRLQLIDGNGLVSMIQSITPKPKIP